ncbi:MazG nucleotide pyrophosphohydrolase domain-containing protein [Virgibacillus senegalensis]|uniref:MazG nucleotide pyrophosphohydrolase domain-containing protein n=1 Tax=Virgibacillus senegalensis TaxID=1499679 RepID=UPI00069D9C5B|nr:MazG nucleotide pyrophosphohydrolase domain-containing protein [Virgibacillus senegalensis]
MKQLQQDANSFQKEMNWEIRKESFEVSREDLLNNYMLLTTEVAEVAEEFRKAFNLTYKAIQAGEDKQEAFEKAKNVVKEDIGKELADCLAYITKMANYFDIDLEDSFYAKMEEVKHRKNKDI